MEQPETPFWLANATFEGLFLRGDATGVLKQHDAERKLAAIASSKSTKVVQRVLAHELLVEAGHAASTDMIIVYCEALPSAFPHNWWGMPGQYFERLGRRLVLYGQLAIPYLSHLLDNQQPLSYFGSEEPTLSQRMQYRVCDLAAYIIATGINVPYKDANLPGVRDEFIRELCRRANH